jgi:6-phosphogluconolactonase (cycloisomerase 2 family)
MTMKVRILLSLLMTLATLWTAGCGHYTCGTTFGGASCGSPGGGGGGGGGGGSGSANAFAYYASQTATLGGIELNSTKGVEAIPNYTAPALPPTYSQAGMTIAQKKFLYAAFAQTSQLFAWSIDSTGNVTALGGSPFSAPYAAGIPQAFQPMDTMITDPAGKYLFIADAIDNEVLVFSIDSKTGALTPVPGSPFPTAGIVQPWNLATDGLGKFLYVAEGNVHGEGQRMAVYSINSSTGSLFNLTAMAINMWQVASEPTGKFMVGTTGETGLAPGGLLDDHIYVFSINQSSGVLTQAAGSPIPTVNGPTRVIVHPNGKFVYDFSLVLLSGFDGPLEGFSIDPNTGALKALSGSPFKTPTTPYGGFFDPSGKYLFVHASGTIGAFNVDGSTGVPTQATGTVAGVGDLVWAVTGP